MTGASDRLLQTWAALGSHNRQPRGGYNAHQISRTDPAIGGVESRAIAEAVCRMPQIFTVSVIGRFWT